MYQVLVSKKAKKFLKNLDSKRQKSLLNVLATLEENPIPFRLYHMKKLEGMENAYRIRIGNIRISYELQISDYLIKVRYIGYRGGAYK